MLQQAGPMALTQLGEDERMFRDTVRQFAVEQIGPLVRGMDEAQQMDAALIKKLFDLGLMGIEVPEEYGGAAGTFFEAILAVEEISSVDPSVGVLVDVQNTLCINALARWATEEQKSKYLTRLAVNTIGAYALSEASSGSDAFALQTRATKRGDDYVLNGQKLWITNAKEAGIFIVFATIDPAAGYKGITAFLVEKDTPGFTLGKKEDKLGIRASSTCELIFRDCVIPASQVSRRTRQRLQDRHRNPERRPHRHRRTDARPRTGSMGTRRKVGERTQAVRQAHRRVPGNAVPASRNGNRHRSGASARLQRRPVQGREARLPQRSGHVQILRLAGSRARRQPRGRGLRRLRFRQGLPRRKALPRLQDR